MKAKRVMQFGLVFLLLAAFSVASLGIVNSDGDLVKSVSALEQKDISSVYLQVSDEAFDNKVLSFLKVDKVCALTAEQAIALSGIYAFENKEFSVNGNDVRVLYLKGNPINRNIIDAQVGPIDTEKCQVVHGNKIIAVLSPVLIS